MPNEIGILAVAAVVTVVIVLVARRSRGDRPDDRGPYSTAMEARGDFAAMGRTIDERSGESSDQDSERQSP